MTGFNMELHQAHKKGGDLLLKKKDEESEEEEEEEEAPEEAEPEEELQEDDPEKEEVKEDKMDMEEQYELAKLIKEEDINVVPESSDIDEIDKLTGMPRPGDGLMFCIPMLAPYSTTNPNKYKVKV